jgi:hypothetical protein
MLWPKMSMSLGPVLPILWCCLHLQCLPCVPLLSCPHCCHHHFCFGHVVLSSLVLSLHHHVLLVVIISILLVAIPTLSPCCGFVVILVQAHVIMIVVAVLGHRLVLGSCCHQ